MQAWIPDIASEWERAHGIIQMMLLETNAPMAAKKASSMANTTPPSILVVEDDPMASKIVEQHLKKFGPVIAISNSRQATANYNVRRPDLVFLDIHYKDDLYDGFDVLANLLSVDTKAFVVMVSGDRDPATIIKALSLGAQGFIAKPFRASDFAHYLATFSGK